MREPEQHGQCARQWECHGCGKRQWERECVWQSKWQWQWVGQDKWQWQRVGVQLRHAEEQQRWEKWQRQGELDGRKVALLLLLALCNPVL